MRLACHRNAGLAGQEPRPTSSGAQLLLRDFPDFGHFGLAGQEPRPTGSGAQLLLRGGERPQAGVECNRARGGRALINRDKHRRQRKSPGD